MATFLDIPRPVETYHSKAYDRISPANAQLDSKDKIVLITGGASGVGLSISKSFAQAGVKRIIITSRSPGPQAEAKKALHATYPNVEVLTFQKAVTDQSGMDEIMRTYGPVDVLVLCAGIAHEHKPALGLPMSTIEECFNTNVIGNYGTVKSYLEQQAPSTGEKTIINVSSAVIQWNRPLYIGYGPSKAAFTKMITQLAAEYPPETGVRMFSYHPGAFYTPMAERAGYVGNEIKWEDIKLPGDFAVWLAGRESTFLNGKFVWAHWDVDELIALKKKIQDDPDFLSVGLLQ